MTCVNARCMTARKSAVSDKALRRQLPEQQGHHFSPQPAQCSWVQDWDPRQAPPAHCSLALHTTSHAASHCLSHYLTLPRMLPHTASLTTSHYLTCCLTLPLSLPHTISHCRSVTTTGSLLSADGLCARQVPRGANAQLPVHLWLVERVLLGRSHRQLRDTRRE